MTLGIVLPPADSPLASAAIRQAASSAAAADAAGADFIVVSRPAVPGLSPVLVAAHLAAHTTQIGLVADTPADGAEPFHLSTALATLDHVSHGRGGWLVGPADGTDDLADAAAVIDAVARLWDSWEDDVVIRDTSTGRYLDRARLHAIDLQAATFRIAGPSITPRPPQGRLPIIAGAALADTQPATAWIEIVRGQSLVERHVRNAADVREVRDALAAGVSVLARPETRDALALLLAASPGSSGAETPATTLRERFGLARPRSVYAGAE
ncbi:LLM class flavin-dependent oxidoreductase [Microbacterium gilvum]|uniref:Luciferase-like domain-containing protein n=1 Tax=Microbacterium gilvum TaxID=1336204 RepID=A0ABP8ZW94_9MICO